MAYDLSKIIKRDGRVVPFKREKIVFAIYRAAVAVGGRNRKLAEAVTDDVVNMLKRQNTGSTYPTVEEVQDIVEKCLIERGHAKTAKAYIIYRYEHELKRRGKDSLTYSGDNIPYRKLWEALAWAVDHNCSTIQALNTYVRQGQLATLIQASENFYQTELANAFAKIEERIQDIRLLIVAGPSASGKTTTLHKLASLLKNLGKRFITLEIDNYFFDLEQHPQDPWGDYDFETPQALDLELIKQHLQELLEGHTIKAPHYDFKTGKRTLNAKSLSLPGDGLILIDSLHGLYPEMTAGIDDKKKFRLYIETLAQIKDHNHQFVRWADLRLLRRMVRDLNFRNYNPTQTILHWYHVRRAELRYIILRLKSADAIVNTWLAYELPFLKNRLAPFIKDFLKRYQNQPDFEDALQRATRIAALFKEILATSDESQIPPSSLFREFIGGQRL